MMKSDSKTSSYSVRPIFRILAIPLGLLFLVMGLGGLIVGVLDNTLCWDHNTRFYISATVLGVSCMVVAYRGRLI
jgi:hypothetical protein